MDLLKFANRKFKFWYYTVSHSQALIRSIGLNGACNIDIYFGDVLYIEIPSDFSDLTIDETTTDDIKYINNRLRKDIEPNKVTVLVCNVERYYVVSTIKKVMENQLSLFELPFDS